MAKKVVAIGKQSFESVIENDNFYVDKTFFIKYFFTFSFIEQSDSFKRTYQTTLL